MLRGILLLIPILAAFAADTDDPWKKVRELKTGTEIRVIRSGAAKAEAALYADLTDESLVVILKNAQVAIPRDKVFRIDRRIDKGYVNTETVVSPVNEAYTRSQPTPPGRAPSTSTATGIAINSKPEYATIYRRPPSPPPAKK